MRATLPRSTARAAAAILLTAALSSCGVLGIGDSGDEAPTSFQDAKAGAQADAATFLSDLTAEDVDAAITALEDRVGASPAQLTHITLASGYITFDAVDPAAPDELNSWSYTDGELSEEPVPVDYGGDVEALQQNVFSTDDIDPAGVVAAVDAAPGAAEIEDGQSTGIDISRNTPTSLDLQMLVSVASERDSATVRTDLTGAVVEVF